MENKVTAIELGKTSEGRSISLLGAMACRHGLIAGATGTGKTVTLQTIAHGFSKLGVPVFAADVKGDLSGLAAPAVISERISERLARMKINCFEASACPVVFWDLYAKRGHPLRTTVSEVGPLLFARILELNDTQTEVLQVIFKIADDSGLLLLDLKDVREMLAWVSENARALKQDYGNLASATLGSIQRAVLNLSERGGEEFFNEPALDLKHLCQHDFSGRGVISILDAAVLLQDPLLYSTYLLWLMSELFEQLPEVGDLPLPKLVFFFDEAHLLFRDTPSSLLSRIEQVVRLIRSKGVGVYFVTQNPADIPDSVLAQLGNRVQHALRAYTPKEQKSIQSAAESFRLNPLIDTRRAITELEVGEALVSVLDADGRPTVVERTLINPPESQIGALSDALRMQIFSRSPLAGLYDTPLDRESAFEMLRRRKSLDSERKPNPRSHPDLLEQKSIEREGRQGTRSSSRDSVADALIKSAARSIGSSLGRQLIRGILGSLRR